MDIDLEHYRKQFCKEARDILERANSGILKAETDVDNEHLLNSIFREVHTIKGSAGSFELWKVSDFTHHLENLLASLRDKKLKLNSEIVDVILNSLDYIEKLLEFYEQGVDFEIDTEKVRQIKQFQIHEETEEKIKEEEKPFRQTILENEIPKAIAETLRSNLEIGHNTYFIEILYTDLEYQNGYDPFALLKNIRNNSITYVAVTDKTVIPPFEDFNNDHLYLKPSVYCTSELSREAIVDLAFDSSLLRVYEVTFLTELTLEKEEPYSQELINIDKSILNEFLVSVEDIHLSIEECLLQYEKDFSEISLNRLFRYIHTIKGDADYIGLRETVKLAHDLESLLDKLRKGSEKPSRENIDKIFNSVDEIYSDLIYLNRQIRRETGIAIIGRDKPQNLDAAQDSGYSNQTDIMKEVFLEHMKQVYEMMPIQASVFPGSPIAKKNIIRMLKTLGRASEVVSVKTLAELCNTTLQKMETVTSNEDLNNSLFDLLSFIDGFMVGTPKKIGQILIDEKVISSADLQEALKKQKPIGKILIESGKASEEDIEKALRKQEISILGKQLKASVIETPTPPETVTMKIEESKVDVFHNLIGEMIVARNTYDFCLTQLTSASNGELELVAKALTENLHVISRITNEMQRGIMAMRMVPVKTIFQKFYRVVRDIARKQKKDIELTISGENIEIDKRVADTLSDPLVHLIRNSCDHGIETVEERIAVGKSEVASIILKASYEGNHAVIRILDNGKGLNTEKIAAKAETMGYPINTMSEEEINNLIFLPGFSTADKVTEVSGRGVGMDVVLSTAKSLGGFAKIRSVRGHSTETIISIPISMGISKALLVESNGSEFALPLESIIETIRIQSKDIHILDNRLFFYFRGDVLPLDHLNHLLNFKNSNGGNGFHYYYELQNTNTEVSIVVLNTSENGRFAVIVDKLKKNMEIAIKPVPQQLGDLGVLSGVTIMGDGKIVQVLNVEGLR